MTFKFLSTIKCARCGKEIKKRSSNHIYCKECKRIISNAYKKKFYDQNKQRMKERVHQYRLKKKKEGINLYREYIKKRPDYHAQYREKNKEKLLNQFRIRYFKNKEQHANAGREWCERNPEHCKQWRSQYHKKNKVVLKKKSIIYRSQNKEAISLRGKKYTETHKEQIRARHKKYLQSAQGKLTSSRSCRKRRAHKNNINETFTQEEWIEKVKLTEGICPECNVFVGTDKLCLDHIYPISKAEKGRLYTINDVQPLCRACNASKGYNINS